jgi:hypothetical protein
MSDGNSIINLGDISKPAVVLIEKISDAIGGIFKPHQIVRVASAEAEVEKIKAKSQIEITELQQRAYYRFIEEEAKKQSCIESVTVKALPYLKDDARPTEVESDWITNFFDKARLISDEQMQILWAKVLAGEANSPGSYSKRTINLLNSLDKSDAILFNTFCGFVWILGNNLIPLIYSAQDSIYTENGVTFNDLKHLDDIGMINFSEIAGSGYTLIDLPKSIYLSYYGTEIDIDLPKDQNNVLSIGLVLLTKAGQELASICCSECVPNFIDYILIRFRDNGYITSSSYPRTFK